MEKRLVIALALSILVILGLQYFTVKPTPPVGTQTIEKTGIEPAKDVTIAMPKLAEPTVAEIVLPAQTDKYALTFSNIGGAIKEIGLKDFKEIGSAESLSLVRINNPADYLFSTSSAGMPGLSMAGYEVERLGNSIVYTADVDGLQIMKRYTLHNTKRGIELEIIFKNMSGSSRTISYSIIGGAGLSEALEQDRRLIEATASIDGKVVGFKAPKNGKIINPGAVKWSALKNKYFSLTLIPLSGSTGQFYTQNNPGDLNVGVNSESLTILPGQSVGNKYILYVGPSHVPALKEFGYGIEEIVNYGFFGGISKALLIALRFIHSIVRSWGMSVILLSILLNIILFPLTVKSFSSMQKMQALHPQMEKLKKLNKDNPQKLNKDIMELYKKYKINPLSGCLPMVLQMPIFIALYQALMKSIELRNAKFLWISDLSSPDAIRLPITLPILGNSINILPLIMVGAMVAQQKMSTKSMGGAVTDEQKQQQKMMLIIMPIMFGFIFYNMPSGLVLYWIVNTVLTVVEQKAVMKNAVVEE